LIGYVVVSSNDKRQVTFIASICMYVCVYVYLYFSHKTRRRAHTDTLSKTQKKEKKEITVTTNSKHAIMFATLKRWFGSRVVSVLDSGAEGPWFKSQPRRCRVTVLGKLLTPIVPLFTKQQNW